MVLQWMGKWWWRAGGGEVFKGSGDGGGGGMVDGWCGADDNSSRRNEPQDRKRARLFFFFLFLFEMGVLCFVFVLFCFVSFCFVLLGSFMCSFYILFVNCTQFITELFQKTDPARVIQSPPEISHVRQQLLSDVMGSGHKEW